MTETPVPIGSMCDCSGAASVVTSYPVGEIHGYAQVGSDKVLIFEQGTWGVCGDCRPLVEARDVQGLVDRADAVYGANQPPDSRAILRQSITNLYELILANRGEAVPIGEWREWVA